MAGVTDRPFRQLCRELGAGYVVTEMIAADPSLRGSKKSMWRSDFEGEAAPISVQIAGSDPQWLANAAQYNVQQGAQIIDINMGCPVKKVLKKLAGSALLSDVPLVEQILRAVVAAVDVPVTLKIRTGPTKDNLNGVQVAQLAEQCGIAALAVHGRTREQRFKGEAEYQTIRAICDSVSIPVFANGDVTDPEQAKQVLEYTGAAGLMVGRGAQGNPWIFRELNHYLETGQTLKPPSTDELYAVIREHVGRLHQFYGEHTGVRVARKHINWYLKDRQGADPVLYELVRVPTSAEQLKLLDRHFRHHSQKAA
jgi:tRNA-dihydrouridine synthase B